MKVAWIEGEELEHIWFADLDFAGERPRGVVANESSLPSLKFMQTVEFEPAQITDWMYIDDGFFGRVYYPSNSRSDDAGRTEKIRCDCSLQVSRRGLTMRCSELGRAVADAIGTHRDRGR